MNENKYEPVFIPCGDSFEKMNEICEDVSEKADANSSDENCISENE